MGIKVKVDLDVNTDKLANTIQQGVAKGFTGGMKQGLATDPSIVARQIMGDLAAGMKGHGDTAGLIIPPLSNIDRAITPPPAIKAFQASMRLQEKQRLQQSQFLKNIGFAGIPLLNPTSVFGNLFASRQIFSGLSGPTGQGLLSKVGLGGSAGGAAAATGVVMAGLLAIGLALKALQITIRETAKAFEEARKLYAKTLISGLGLNFTIGRKNLADVLGVSEKEVLQFGAAISTLGPKLKFATDTMSKTTPNLASVAFEFSILKKDMEALFFTIANEAAPALRTFADAMSKLVVAFTRFLQHDPIAKFIESITVGKYSSLNVLAHLLGGSDSGPAASPQGLMKQLPASHLERMGLVVGGFGTQSDFASRTAKATEKSSKLLEQIVRHIGGQSSSPFGEPFYNYP